MAVKKRSWQTVWLDGSLGITAVRLCYGRTVDDAIAVEIRQGRIWAVYIGSRSSEVALATCRADYRGGGAPALWRWLAAFYKTIHDEGETL